MNRKAQGALEFLTTYGWAFLVILIMIGALGYFGILNPTKFLPERCNVNSEFGCEEFALTRANDTNLQMAIVLTNNLGQGLDLGSTMRVSSDVIDGSFVEDSALINSSTVALLDSTNAMECGWTDDDSVINAENSFTLMCELDGSVLEGSLPSVGNKLKLNLQLDYIPQGKTLSKTLNVEVFGTLQ